MSFDPRQHPDPLAPPHWLQEQLDEAYDAGIADAHRLHVLAWVLAVGLGIVIGFVIAGSVFAASRSGQPVEVSVSPPRQVAPATAGRSEAPPARALVTVASQGPSAASTPLAAPTQLSDEGGIWGTPPDTATDLRQGRTGILAQAKGHGPNYLAIPIGLGHLVEVCGPAACWTTVSTDGGPNRAMLKAGRIADVAVGHWVVICGVPAVLGLCDGSWHVVSAGTTPPPTDVSR